MPYDPETGIYHKPEWGECIVALVLLAALMVFAFWADSKYVLTLKP